MALIGQKGRSKSKPIIRFHQTQPKRRHSYHQANGYPGTSEASTQLGNPCPTASEGTSHNDLQIRNNLVCSPQTQLSVNRYNTRSMARGGMFNLVPGPITTSSASSQSRYELGTTYQQMSPGLPHWSNSKPA